MSFFSFLGKTVGKIAKAGLGVATGGISTQIIDTVGGLLQKKKQAVNQQNLYEAAGLTDKYAPPARRTESAMPGAGYIPAYGGGPVNVSRPARRTRKRAAAAPRRAAAPRMRAKKKRRAGGGRTPPPGGLDLKAMSRDWRAAGSPGTWQQWIASNPIHRA